MTFASFSFLLIFLPLCIVVHSFAGNNRWRNHILLIFSFIFYAWGEPIRILQMIFSGVAIWLLGKKLNKITTEAKYAEKVLQKKRKQILIAGVVIALLPLFFFKYAGFTVLNLNALLGIKLPVPSFSLPIGISFYTFQIITYLVDVYRHEAVAQQSLPHFLLYEAFFPQLIAGPIVRYRDIDKQIRHRQISRLGMLDGLERFMVGLFKKTLIANYAGKIVAATLEANLTQLSGLEILLGALGFTLQIYFDFSAYSDMAIGLAQFFGFKLRENFDRPYVSASVTEFWRRWHISLSTFFRDYVYIPLGGNRKHQIRNLTIVWLLTGLWHGASWNFVLWGAYFLVLLIFEKYVLKHFFTRIPKFFSYLYMIPVILFGWMLFYFTDLQQLALLLKQLFSASFYGLTGGLLLRRYGLFLVLAVSLSFTSWPRLKQRFSPSRKTPFAAAANWSFYFKKVAFPLLLWIISFAALAADSFNPFLYFRF